MGNGVFSWWQRKSKEEAERIRSARLASQDVDSEPLWSMANLRKDRSGLPVNIWLDESQTYKSSRHGYRIKFQRDKGDRVSKTNLSTMTISDNPQVIGDHELSSKEITMLKNFVIRNKQALIQLSDMEISIFDFAEQMA